MLEMFCLAKPQTAAQVDRKINKATEKSAMVESKAEKRFKKYSSKGEENIRKEKKQKKTEER